MTDYQRLRPSCWWCGYQFTPYDQWSGDHWLWCGKRPADA